MDTVAFLKTSDLITNQRPPVPLSHLVWNLSRGLDHGTTVMLVVIDSKSIHHRSVEGGHRPDVAMQHRF